MILLKDKYAVYLGTRIIRLGKAQLLTGAQHAKAFHAPHNGGVYYHAARKGCAIQSHRNQCAFKYIGSAGDDDKVFLSADIKGAYLKLIGIGMLLYLFDAAHHNVGNAGHLIDNFGYLKAAPHHKLNELFGSYVEVNIFF